MSADPPPELKAELFDQLLETTPHDLVWVFSAEWDELVFLSDEYEALWGRSRDALDEDPRDFLNGVHPDDRAAVTDAMERVSGGDSVDIEYRVTPDGESSRWMWAHGEPISADTGDVVRVAGFVRDITAHKERERELERYETVIEMAPDGAYVLDSDFRFTFVNDALVEMTGYEREDLHGTHASVIFDEDALEEAKRIRERLKTADGQFGRLETEIRTASDGRLPCAIRGQLLSETEGGDPWGTVGIIRDITARKERERELEARSTAMQASIDGMAILDDEEEYVFVNQAHADIYGYDDPEAFIGETWRMCYDESELERFEEEVMPTLFEDGAWRGETVGTRADGSTFPQELSLTVADDGRIVCVVRDITERKRRERALEQQNERLEAFAETVSHDLRNPLNVAIGRLELVQEECNSDHLDHVADALDRSNALIDDLLTLAREGERVNAVEPVPLSDVVERCWRNIATAEATVVVETERTIRADRSRLQQLLENVMRNAVEHGGEGVTVTVGDVTDGFYVADDGSGIPADEREEVFEAGYSTTDDGTGLGLTIVREIAHAHDWDITATESEPGGARFTFRGITPSPVD